MTAPQQLSLLHIHHRLQEHFGALNWWPAETPFEVVIGAILTQNTAWTNVEMAISNLRQQDALTPATLAQLPLSQLEVLIRPAGYFRQKAERLQELSGTLSAEYQGDVANWCQGPLDEARTRLLQQRGIGPETADSILLYAANRPTFVVDAYTRRSFTRLGHLSGKESYNQIRDLFMKALPQDAELFNAYHAEIVELAKQYCHKQKPLCPDCPLVDHCPTGQKQLGLS